MFVFSGHLHDHNKRQKAHNSDQVGKENNDVQTKLLMHLGSKDSCKASDWNT